MTNQIEQEFYKAFDIEPIELDYPDNTEVYPEITDRILLELIVYLSGCGLSIPRDIVFKDINKLKEHILKCAMKFNTMGGKAKFHTENVRKIMGV